MDVEKFESTNSRLGAIFTVTMAAVVAGYGILDHDRGFPTWGIAAACLFGVLSWAAMVRPALWAEDDTLVMHNMFETVRVPMAAIESYVVRQVLTVQVDGQRFASPAVGRRLGKAARSSRFVDTSQTTLASMATQGEAMRSKAIDHADFIEERLHARFDQARATAGVRKGSPEQAALASGVRREPAWVPIVLCATALIALIVTILV